MDIRSKLIHKWFFVYNPRNSQWSAVAKKPARMNGNAHISSMDIIERSRKKFDQFIDELRELDPRALDHLYVFVNDWWDEVQKRQRRKPYSFKKERGRLSFLPTKNASK